MKKRHRKSGAKLFEGAAVTLVALAAVALIAIIVYVLLPFICKRIDIEAIPDASVNGLVLSCITLSITFSVIVPWMMSKSQIHSVVEDSVKKYYDKDFKQTIQKTHDTLFRAYANDSRMIAYFLTKHNKPVWALGWVCKSSISYDNIQGENQHKTYTALSVSNVFVLIECVLGLYAKLSNGVPFVDAINEDNDEKLNEVAIRTTRDLVKFCSTQELRDKDYDSVFVDNKGKDIPETLSTALNDLLRCLVKYLEKYCRDNGDSLFERLELENEDEINEETHIAYYSLVERKCRNIKLEDLKSQFIRSSSSLNKMYDNYLASRVS